MRTLRARVISTGAGVKVIAVESVELQHGRRRGGGHLYGKLEPIAVVVCSWQDAHALDMEGGAADLDRLREQLPKLDAVVGAFMKAAH